MHISASMSGVTAGKHSMVSHAGMQAWLVVQEHPLPEEDDEVAGAPGDCTDEVPGPSSGQDLDAQVPSSKGGQGLELLWHCRKEQSRSTV